MKSDVADVSRNSERISYGVVDDQNHQAGIKHERQTPALAPVDLINAKKCGQAGRDKQESVANNEAELLLNGLVHPIGDAKRHNACNGANVSDEVSPKFGAKEENERRRHYKKGAHIVGGASRAKGLAPVLRIDVDLKHMLEEVKQG